MVAATTSLESRPKLLGRDHSAAASHHVFLQISIDDFALAWVVLCDCIFGQPHQFVDPSKTQLGERKTLKLPTQLLQANADGINQSTFG